MPQPTQGAVHQNVPLANVSLAYMQDQREYVSTRVFPIVPVDKVSNTIYIFTKDDWFRDEAKKRAPGTPSAGSGYGVSTTTYTTDTFAIHKDVPDDIRKSADSVFNMDREATEFVTQRLLLRMEKQWVTDYFTTSIWGTDNTTATDWDDYANSDPIGDVQAAIRAIKIKTGKTPNKFVLGYDVFIKLVSHPDILARINGGATNSQPALVNEEMLARIFGVDEVLVCGAINNTAAEGATATYAFVQGKHALLVYVPPAAGLLTPAAGYTFLWTGISTTGQTVGMRKFRMEDLKADRVEGEIAFDNKVMGADLGYFFSSIVS